MTTVPSRIERTHDRVSTITAAVAGTLEAYRDEVERDATLRWCRVDIRFEPSGRVRSVLFSRESELVIPKGSRVPAADLLRSPP